MLRRVGFQSDKPNTAYANHVKAVYPGPRSVELFDAADVVTDFMRHPGWHLVGQLVDAERSDLDARLDGRLLDTRAEYASLHGKRAALRAFEEAAHALVAVAERRLAEQQAKHERAAEPALNGGAR